MDMRYLVRGVVLVAVAGSTAAQADDTQLGFTVGNVAITKYISPANLGLVNKATLKTVAARDWQATGNDPMFTVTGQVFCKNDARLVAVQAILGKIVLNNGQLIALGTWGHSPKQTAGIAGRSDANVSFNVKLPVTRTVGKAAVDFTFNPAREFEKKLKAFVAKGGSAAAYLRETQAFDIPVMVNLVAWCKKPENSDSVLAGKTYAGYSARAVPVTILYNGDPKIIDGAGVRATAGAGGVMAPSINKFPPQRKTVKTRNN